jgi:hypothetical protein
MPETDSKKRKRSDISPLTILSEKSPSTGDTELEGERNGPYNTVQGPRPAPQYEDSTGNTWPLNERTGEYDEPRLDIKRRNLYEKDFKAEKMETESENITDSGGKRRRTSRRTRMSRKRRTVKRKRKRKIR